MTNEAKAARKARKAAAIAKIEAYYAPGGEYARQLAEAKAAFNASEIGRNHNAARFGR